MFQVYVPNISYGRMLQMFYLDVAKVDRNVALVAVAIHICFKCMFQMFYLVL